MGGNGHLRLAELPMMRDTPHPSILTVATLVLLAAMLHCFVEIYLAGCLSLHQTAVYVGAWTLILLPFLAYKPSRGKLVIYMLFLGFSLIVFLVPWNSRKVFLRDFDRIKPGMTVAQVKAVMGKYIQGTGWPAIPGGGPGQLVAAGSDSHFATGSSGGELVLTGCLVFRHSHEARFNSDWGVVRFKDGVVVATEFLPD